MAMKQWKRDPNDIEDYSGPNWKEMYSSWVSYYARDASTREPERPNNAEDVKGFKDAYAKINTIDRSSGKGFDKAISKNQNVLQLADKYLSRIVLNPRDYIQLSPMLYTIPKAQELNTAKDYKHFIYGIIMRAVQRKDTYFKNRK